MAAESISLHTGDGRRKYLTQDERLAFLAAAAKAPREVRTFCEVLTHTGCRPVEALALTPERIDIAAEQIVIESAKKRREGVFRAIPVPSELIQNLELVHGLRDRRRFKQQSQLWDWSLPTAARRVKEVMAVAEIEGPHASARGLRHGFGVAAVTAGVPLNVLQQLLGHASLETTSIYANAMGPERRAIVEKMW